MVEYTFEFVAKARGWEHPRGLLIDLTCTCGHDLRADSYDGQLLDLADDHEFSCDVCGRVYEPTWDGIGFELEDGPDKPVTLVYMQRMSEYEEDVESLREAATRGLFMYDDGYGVPTEIIDRDGETVWSSDDDGPDFRDWVCSTIGHSWRKTRDYHGRDEDYRCRSCHTYADEKYDSMKDWSRQERQDDA